MSTTLSEIDAAVARRFSPEILRVFASIPHAAKTLEVSERELQEISSGQRAVSSALARRAWERGSINPAFLRHGTGDRHLPMRGFAWTGWLLPKPNAAPDAAEDRFAAVFDAHLAPLFSDGTPDSIVEQLDQVKAALGRGEVSAEKLETFRTAISAALAA